MPCHKLSIKKFISCSLVCCVCMCVYFRNSNNDCFKISFNAYANTCIDRKKAILYHTSSHFVLWLPFIFLSLQYEAMHERCPSIYTVYMFFYTYLYVKRVLNVSMCTFIYFLLVGSLISNKLPSCGWNELWIFVYNFPHFPPLSFHIEVIQFIDPFTKPKFQWLILITKASLIPYDVFDISIEMV